MHFEILVEGQSELTTLSIIMPKIVGQYGEPNTWKIHKHQGIGSLPDDIARVNSTDRSLLGQLPAKLRAYGEVNREDCTIIVMMDLDDRDKSVFTTELNVLTESVPQLSVEFCFAIEELEAWFLADRQAISEGFETADFNELDSYQQDSICNTWEVLAKIVAPEVLSLGKRSRQLLQQKVNWARKIAPLMNVQNNCSPSFMDFRDRLLAKL